MAGIKGMKSYPLEVKLEAVRLFFEVGETRPSILEKLGIKNDSQLEEWFRSFRKYGYAGLQPKPKGRRPTITKNHQTQEERIKQLEMENELLRNFLLELERM